MPDTRQKYQVNLPLTNGQAFELVTLMPLKAIMDEIQVALEDARWARFDAMNPVLDTRVDVLIDPKLISGIIHREWERPQPQRGAAPPSLSLQ